MLVLSIRANFCEATEENTYKLVSMFASVPKHMWTGMRTVFALSGSFSWHLISREISMWKHTKTHVYSRQYFQIKDAITGLSSTFVRIPDLATILSREALILNLAYHPRGSFKGPEIRWWAASPDSSPSTWCWHHAALLVGGWSQWEMPVLLPACGSRFQRWPWPPYDQLFFCHYAGERCRFWVIMIKTNCPLRAKVFCLKGLGART